MRAAAAAKNQWLQMYIKVRTEDQTKDGRVDGCAWRMMEEWQRSGRGQAVGQMEGLGSDSMQLVPCVQRDNDG